MKEALQVELDTAKKSAKQAAESAQYAINTCASGDRSLAENAIERGMAKSMEAMNHMAKALTIINECGHESSPYEPYEEAQALSSALPINMQTMVDFEDSGAIRCVFLTPPMTKSRAQQIAFLKFSVLICRSKSWQTCRKVSEKSKTPTSFLSTILTKLTLTNSRILITTISLSSQF